MVAGAFKMDTVNIGGFQIEGVILVGAALCVLTYIVTDGGTKKIASLFSKLVPLMSRLQRYQKILQRNPKVPVQQDGVFWQRNGSWEKYPSRPQWSIRNVPYLPGSSH